MATKEQSGLTQAIEEMKHAVNHQYGVERLEDRGGKQHLVVTRGWQGKDAITVMGTVETTLSANHFTATWPVATEDAVEIGNQRLLIGVIPFALGVNSRAFEPGQYVLIEPTEGSGEETAGSTVVRISHVGWDIPDNREGNQNKPYSVQTTDLYGVPGPDLGLIGDQPNNTIKFIVAVFS